MSRHFAVDLGAESGRCMVGVYDPDKNTMQCEELNRFATQGLKIRNGVHWNVFRYYESILQGLKEYVSRYGKELDSIGIDAWGVDYALIDKRGEIIGLPYCYRDKRVNGSIELIDSILPKKQVYDITGIQFLEINTLSQMAAAVNREECSLEYATDIMFIGDVLHYMLGAKICAEYTGVSISQLYDNRVDEWSEKIAKTFKLPKFKTEVCKAGDVIGTLSDEIADEVGLQRGVKIVAPAVHDTASAAVAIPTQQDNCYYISSGTWSLVGIELDEPVINEKSLNMSLSNSGGALDKILFLKNVMGLWLIQQCKRMWDRQHDNLTYSKIVEYAKKENSFGAFIDPDDTVFLNPENMPKAICDYIRKTGQGEIEESNIGLIARIIYESLAMKYRLIFERIADIVSKEVEVIHIIGGGSKNKLLCRFTANAMGVKVTAGPAEGTALGNLLMQAYGCGRIEDLKSMRKVVALSSEIEEFFPEDTEQWEKAYERFKKMC